MSPKSAFRASRLTPSTFLLIEHSDSYGDDPCIYAKMISEANTILIIDTGCGGETKDPKIELKSLRGFVETVGIEDNGGKALNEGGKMGYVVVLSHCHYDHIRAYPASYQTNSDTKGDEIKHKTNMVYVRNLRLGHRS